ncbi:MAG: RNA ligase [Methermicoccaceae archaeon]
MGDILDSIPTDVKEQFERYSYRGESLYLLPRAYGGFERGTVVFRGHLIRGFPKIRRILMLKEGIMRYFDSPFVVEEKLDGYNVRVCSIDGEIFAFTRGGFICPFTLPFVREHRELCEFLKSHPELMICCEVVGRNNPYAPEEYPEAGEISLFAFDIRMREEGTPLLVYERRELLEEWSIPQVKMLGSFKAVDSDIKRLMNIIDELNNEGREGVVIKSPDMSVQVKYTTHASNIGNLKHAFKFTFDFGRDFVFSRIVREGFQAFEWGEDNVALAKRAEVLGRAILYPMVDIIRQLSEGERAEEEYTLTFQRWSDAQQFFRHLRGLGINYRLHDKKWSEKGIDVRFGRIHQPTEDRIKMYLSGGYWKE